MIKLVHPSKVEVRPSEGKGMGVFAKQFIRKGDPIEDCHLLFLPQNEGLLDDYRFNWPAGQDDYDAQVIPLGFGAIYNHSNDNNISWMSHPDSNMFFRFYALRDIMPGEECCSYYGNTEFP